MQLQWRQSKRGSLYYVDLGRSTTPEIYIGYKTATVPLETLKALDRIRQFHTHNFLSGTNFKPDVVYLQGEWKNNPANMELQSDTGRIVLVYYGKSVNIE